jgi:sugar lactone lactonase YvrE
VARLRTLGEGFSFLEGPRWHDGRLYVSDFYTHRVLAFADDSQPELVCTVEGRPSGLGFDPSGNLLIVSMTDQRLLRLRDDALEEVASLARVADSLCNDMLVDPQGRAYIGNFGITEPTVGATRLARVDPDGTVHVAADGLVFPNGSALTDGGRTMLVSETFAARIAAFDVAADGTLSNRRTWASFGELTGVSIAAAVASGAPLPDGMALDAEGAVWIGDAAGQAALRVLDGEIVDRVDTAPLATFAVALGGEEGSTLFLCASPPLLQNDPFVDHQAKLLACEVDVPAPA